jgi:hypothetical protein
LLFTCFAQLVRTLLLFLLELHADLMQILSRLISALLPAAGRTPDDNDLGPQRTSKVYVHRLDIQPMYVPVPRTEPCPHRT